MKKILLSLLLYGSVISVLFAQKPVVFDLKCEYQTTPLAIESSVPHLSWKIKASERVGVMQHAYQILVAETKEKLQPNEADCWDSELTVSDESVQIPYGGSPVKAGNVYYWTVRVIDNFGKESAWSEPAMWRHSSPDPKMVWIGLSDTENKNDHVASIQFRKLFELKEKPLKEVYASISSPGYYELYINGKRVGTDLLSPAVTGKDKRTFYVTYEISKYLRNGKNVVAIWTGKGWFGAETLPLAFHAEITQGKEKITIATDHTWKATPSCYTTLGTWNWHEFGGETLDARKIVSEWNLLSFNDSHWSNVSVVDAPSPSIVAQQCELNRKGKPFESTDIQRIGDSRYVIDFGKNLTGIMKLTMKQMNYGDTVIIYYADRFCGGAASEKSPAGDIKGSMSDILFSQGTDTFRYAVYNQKDIYIAAGKKREIFESKFNHHGYRYAIVEGIKEAPIEAVSALIETDLERIGSFSCSNSLFNELHKVNDWTMRCLNQGSVYVDCPTRERLGYGDGQVSVESSIYNYYMPNFYRKFVTDWILRQDPRTGRLPNVAPNYQGGGGLGWAGIVAAMTWRNYLYYKDVELLEYAYQPMMFYLENIESRCVDNIFHGDKDPWQSIGDWLAPGRGMDTDQWPDSTCNNFFNNCYRVYLWRIQLKAAKALGKDEDIALCTKKLQEIVPLIHKTYYNEETGIYVSKEQTYLLMPLMADIVPDTLKEDIKKRLENNILQRGSIGTGMLGTYFLIHYLQEIDRNDLLYKMIAHQNYPGWGYMLSQGATTWWEQWNGYWSQIHSCFSSLDGWFYQGLAGIQPINDTAGLKEFRIKPAFLPQLNYVDAVTQSMYGQIKSSWKREAKSVLLTIEVPPNSTALLSLPTTLAKTVMQGKQAIEKVRGVDFVKEEDGYKVYKVTSGCFQLNLYP